MNEAFYSTNQSSLTYFPGWGPIGVSCGPKLLHKTVRGEKKRKEEKKGEKDRGTCCPTVSSKRTVEGRI